MTNKIRYDWSKVTPETLQELAQAASDYHDVACPSGRNDLSEAVQKARWQAVVMEIDQPKIDVLAAAEEYYKARQNIGTNKHTMNQCHQVEITIFTNFITALRAAFEPKP